MGKTLAKIPPLKLNLWLTKAAEVHFIFGHLTSYTLTFFIGTLVIHENKSRVTVRVVYTREFVLQCAASPFANLTPSGLPWISRESPDILRPVSYFSFCNFHIKMIHFAGARKIRRQRLQAHVRGIEATAASIKGRRRIW